MSSREDAEGLPAAARAATSPVHTALAALEGAVGRAATLIGSLRARETDLLRRVSELEETVRSLSSGAIDPQTMLDRMRALERENEELRRRIDSGRQAVERLLAKIRFLEEQR